MKIYDKKRFWSGLGILAIGILFFFLMIFLLLLRMGSRQSGTSFSA